jgi:hypothetical protein
MRNISICLFVISLIIFSAIGCISRNPDYKIIGQWKVVKAIDNGRIDNSAIGRIGFEFFSDKTFIMPTFPNFYNGKWTMLEDGRIKLQHAYGAVTFAKLQGDRLNWEHKNIRIFWECKKSQ